MRRPAATISRKGRTSSGLSGPPKAMSRTESKALIAPPPRRSSARHLVDHVHQRPDVVHWGLLVNAVAEVEDVAGSPRGAVEDLLHRAADLANRREKNGGVEIALPRAVVAEPLPRGPQLHTPVQPEDVAAGLLHERQEPGRPRAEVDDRHP